MLIKKGGIAYAIPPFNISFINMEFQESPDKFPY